jgi:hypothetical protein
MLKLAAVTKRGRKLIRQHGEIWVPVSYSSGVSCLGGKPGIRIKSIRDGQERWMAVEQDRDLAPVDRVDSSGNSMLPKNPDRTHLQFTVAETKGDAA